MKAPDFDECFELIRFISKVDEEELEEASLEMKLADISFAAKIAAKDEFSIAHLQEIVVRSMIDGISYKEAAKQLSDHKKKFKRAFKEATNGIGLG